MSEFSQTYGSFTRTGDYPLEADYIFETEQELIEFYQDDIEKTHLHRGLLKIVGTGDDQALYWVVQEGNELQFNKLLQKIDRDNIYDQLTNLQAQLQTEILDRENADKEIWGDDKENILTGLNSIKKISDALDIEIKKLEKLHNEFNAVVGTTDRDIIEYLKTLPYHSLTEVANVLDEFLNGSDSEDDSINTLPEIKDFLEGYKDTDTLAAILSNLYDKILGTPIPSETFRTLRGIEDSIIVLGTLTKTQVDNLQKELNDTQSGVGLNQDGSYSPDANSNYLQNATSITNALHILDDLIHSALVEYILEPSDEGDVKLTVEPILNGYRIKGNVKLNPDTKNQLTTDENGLYYNINLTYTNGTFQLLVNDNVVSTFNIGAKDLVEDAYYDSSTEELIIIFKKVDGDTQRVKIPVGNLIREWVVDNTHPSKVVELTKEEVFGDGPDKLSADVRISSQADNILTRDGNTLYVGKNQILPDITKAVTDLKNELTTVINSAVEVEKSRAEAKEEALETLIEGEVARATAEEASIRAGIQEILGQFPEILSRVNDLTERVVALETKTSW